MARLRKTEPDEASFADAFLQAENAGPRKTQPKPSIRSSPRKQTVNSYRDNVASDTSDIDEKPIFQQKSTPKLVTSGKQRRLAPLHAASLSKPLQTQPMLLPTAEPEARRCKKSLFYRKLSSPANKATSTPPLSDSSGTEGDLEMEVEESIWCGSDASSDSEDELPSPRKLLHFAGKRAPMDSSQRAPPNDARLDLALRLQKVNLDEEWKEPRSQRTSLKALADVPKDMSRPGTSSDKENNEAILRYSPPRLYSPLKAKLDKPVTPPQSPTKSRLQSPTKTKANVPSPKLRQSLDAFWNAETVNEWNDQYSPRKILKSPNKLRLVQEGNSSPTSSPRKAQSPTKRTKAEREVKQAFEDRKHAVATAFFIELDDTITDGHIRSLAATTGGVRFIWSKTLNSTAGRANWRRETTKLRSLDGTTSTEHRHHASIELAEKVINDEHRLLNVLAHEFCHLANFMVSGIKGQPHGAQFKAWGRACTRAFAHKGVEVTTKHAYEIEYKYVWVCSGEDCGSEFKRHSKSIDPQRHTCGSCRGKLVQVKPTPRQPRKGAPAEKKDATGFAAFVKLHFAATKQSLPPGATQKTVMEALGKSYRAEKERAGQASCCKDGDVEVAHVGGKPQAVNVSGARTVDGGMERLAEELEVIEIADD